MHPKMHKSAQDSDFFVLFCSTDFRCNEKRKDTKTNLAGFGAVRLRKRLKPRALRGGDIFWGLKIIIMSKLESFGSNKFQLPKGDLEKTMGGASEGHHRFLFWTWDTVFHDWEDVEGNKYRKVQRCSDPK